MAKMNIQFEYLYICMYMYVNFYDNSILLNSYAIDKARYPENVSWVDSVPESGSKSVKKISLSNSFLWKLKPYFL